MRETLLILANMTLFCPIRPNFFLALLLSFSALPLAAQRNVVKFTPLRLAVGSLNGAYERVLSDHVSLGLGANASFLYGNSDFVFDTEVIEGSNFAYSSSDLNGLTLTPEAKIYVGGNAPRGFYLNPFVRYLGYTQTGSGTYTGSAGEVSSVNLRTRFSGGGAGFGIGAQWLIADMISIDWYGGLGLAVTGVGVSATGQGALFNDAQAFVDEINAQIDQIPFVGPRFDVADIVDNELRARAGGIPFPILRTGLAVGIAF